MAEYVELEELMRYQPRRGYYDEEHINEQFLNGVESVLKYAKDIAVVDIEPVIYGMWIWNEDEYEYECSVCHQTFDYDKTYDLFDHDFQAANYCPYCGAKMLQGHEVDR